MKNHVTHIVSFCLVLLWVYAAGTKLLDYQQYSASMMRQQIPAWGIGLVTVILPAAEMLAALLLCFATTRAYGLLTSVVLLFSFTSYIALALSGAYGSIPCSCGGVFSFMGWKGHLIFNVSAPLVAFSGWYQNRKQIDLTVDHTRKYYVHNRKQAENL